MRDFNAVVEMFPWISADSLIIVMRSPSSVFGDALQEHMTSFHTFHQNPSQGTLVSAALWGSPMEWEDRMIQFVKL